VPGLKKIEYVPGKGLVIGGAASPHDLVFSEVLHKRYNSVSNAAPTMAANQIRPAGTVAGNIVSAVPSADLPPILIALGASVKLESVKGERTLPMEEVLCRPGRTVLERGEVLTESRHPRSAMTGSTYFKYALRKAGALAGRRRRGGPGDGGQCIKESAWHSAPSRLSPCGPRSGGIPEGKGTYGGEPFRRRRHRARRMQTSSDQRASEEYRREMSGVFTKRAVRKAIAEGHN
jgi:carbon-monoxide dehydrogenase medium subunit